MPNIIPPLLSSTPPPIVDDDEEDEFGDFRAGVDLSFGCDGLSLPSTPEHLQKSRLPEESLDVNSNSEEHLKIEEKGLEKDFQDRRKSVNSLNSCCGANSPVLNCDTDIQNFGENKDQLAAINGTEVNTELLGTQINEGSLHFENDIQNGGHSENVQQSEIESSNKTDLSQGVDQDLSALKLEETKSRSHIEDLIIKNASQIEFIPEAVADTSCSIYKNVEATLQSTKESSSCEKDEFGDFNSFCGNDLLVKQAEPVANFKLANLSTDANDTDEFGDFEGHLEIKDNEGLKESMYTNGEVSRSNYGHFQDTSLNGLSEEDDFDDFKECLSAAEPSDNSEHEKPKCDQDIVTLEKYSGGCFEKRPADAVDDDFGNFEKFDEDPHTVWKTTFTEDITGSNEDDFGDFSKCSFQADPASCSKSDPPETANEDDFGDFENFSSHEEAVKIVKTEPGEDEFGEFSAAPGEVVERKIEEDCSIGKKAEQIITSAFPVVPVDVEEYVDIDTTKRNVVFDLLKDIMETNALKFQWVNSCGQKALLKALNIDMRNILYGPGWNLGAPKFAASLGSNPLEPLKPEILTPEVVPPKPSQQSEPVASFPAEVPSAQFDWTSSGLTNPLDSAQNDDPQPSNNINLDWSFLETTKTDAVQGEVSQKEYTASPALSLNFEVNHDSLSLKSEGEVDSQHETANEIISEGVSRREVLTSMIPLRETHICEENTSKAQFHISSSDDVQENADDDFDDFQMSLPVVTSTQAVRTETVQKEESAEISEFDEFQTAVTSIQSTQLQCLQPIPVEPLKPVVVHPAATATSSASTAKIEWPAPGLTEDDLQNIELTYTKGTESNETVTKREESPKETSKHAEEDDWTDFISHKETTKTSPQKVQNDLQLSVFNLGNIQPIKPPVPVITPRGLVQTKLSSSGTISPVMSSPVHAHRPQQRLSVKPPDGYQPAIISQQFSKQFMNNTNPNGPAATNSVSLNNYHLHPASYNHSDSFFVPSAKHNTNSSACDDDDWTDFISSQPVPQQQSLSFTPNIIANPNRYDPLREFRLSGDVLNSGGSRKVIHKSSVPSVTTLPDLDFVIAKNRTFTKK